MILEKWVPDTDTGESGGMLPWKILKTEVLDNVISSILMPSQDVITSHQTPWSTPPWECGANIIEYSSYFFCSALQ